MGSGPLRLALVGCGRQMRRNLGPFLRRVPGHEIVVCVDADLAAAKEAQAATNGSLCADTIDVLTPAEVDAAVLAVPPQPSYDLTRELLGRGIHCFVEKPAGPSTAALRALCDLAEDSPEDGSLTVLRIGNWMEKFVLAVSVEAVDGTRLTAPSLDRIVIDFEAGARSGSLLHETRNMDDGWARSGFGPELQRFVDACKEDGDRDVAGCPTVRDAWAGSVLVDHVLAGLPDANSALAARTANL